MGDRIDILIIEDEPVVRDAAAKTLRHEGWSVDSISDPDEAASRLLQCDYSVVLCDLMLSGTSGLDLLRIARGSCPESPFVMITGYATANRALESLRLGAFDFVPKPFDIPELCGVTDRARRFAARNPSATVQPAAASPVPGNATSNVYHLGEHSWALVAEDGSVEIGFGRSFIGTLSKVDRVELPEVGHQLSQSRRLARICCSDQAVHRIWTPLSGSIIALNEQLCRDPGALESKNPTSTWIARILPSCLGQELALLRQTRDEPTRRQIQN